ncbi:hypothetical protein [Kitasatospora sp. NBC_01560]|uniref:hypothetical protein n=1 Tax=Kitasatospora sp. NBC_01560 TaxID=2975965 RepID=UPI003865E2FD
MVVRYPRLNVIFSDRTIVTSAIRTRSAAPQAGSPGLPEPARATPGNLVVDPALRTATVAGRELGLT